MTDHPGKAALAAIMEAIDTVNGIRADIAEFDGDRRGMYAALGDAKRRLHEAVFGTGTSTDLIASVAAYVASLEAENARLREALGLNDEDAMIDEIEEAISDSFDIDWTARTGAKHVVDLLRARATFGGDNG
jgi:hypothetical protein